ncbi:type II toxin-antitoxin system HipA family toxin [Kordiimonas sp.]|uniref:type II toxin-antitoxin system HipA family toxin n=1 Tax=Kordiimonas sp. TaxID=1970157 RepID=UPI003A92A0A2
MTSEAPTEAYVWIWLPEATEPVVAGKLEQDGDRLIFAYGKSYLARDNAIPIYEPELPLRAGTLPLLTGLKAPNCIRDAAPDAWGRRVIINRKMGLKGPKADAADLSELTYLLESGSDRIGSLDFQLSPKDYIPREKQAATLEELISSAQRVEEGVPLTPELDQALFHGTALGGARPKALINNDTVKCIAKFSASNDTYSVVKGEYIAMRLAALVGLSVAPVKLVAAADKDVLLIERFDRIHTGEGWRRRAIISALTLFELDEMMARYASYDQLAEIIRLRFTDPKPTLREMFGRLVFNILCGNTDDHARNHAAFWDGQELSLTPAYDICPQSRAGGEASQAMSILEGQNLSKLSICIEAAPRFLVEDRDAQEIIQHQVQTIRDYWGEVCDEAKLTKVDRDYFWERQFLNPYAFEGTALS